MSAGETPRGEGLPGNIIDVPRVRLTPDPDGRKCRCCADFDKEIRACGNSLVDWHPGIVSCSYWRMRP